MNWGFIGAVAMFFAVALGAFGAHGLKTRVEADMLAVFEVGVRYHLIHALMFFVVATYADRERAFLWAGGLYLLGIFVFSGSLYAMTLSGARWLGAITPLGGLSLLAGHVMLAVGFWRLAASR